MTTLNINGKRVTVDESFLSLTPDEQQATVDQIASQMGSPEQEPPQGGNIADSLGQGLSFGFADEVAGGLGATVNSAANLFGKGTGESFGEAYTGIRDAARENKAAFAARNPKTAIAAEIAGGMVTGGAGAARVGALRAGNSLRHMAAIGAAEGGIYGIGASEADTVGGVAKDAAIGTALGGAGGYAIPAAGRYIGGRLRAAGRNLRQTTVSREAPDVLSGAVETAERSVRPGRYADDVALLRSEGITLTTGQRTGATGVKALETTVDKTIVGGAVDRTFRRQREQFQKRLMRMAGFPEDAASTGKINDDTLDAAGDALSRRYDEALEGRKINLDSDEFLDDLVDVEATHSRLLTPQQKKEVGSLINDFLDEAIDGPISGREYQAQRSFLQRRAQQFSQSRPEMSDLFRGLRRALDDAFVRETGSSNRELNSMYAHYSQLDDIWRKNGGAAVAQGELPLASLNRAAKKFPGTDDWKRFINAGSAVFGDVTPNSGTASRMANLAMGGSALTGGLDAGIMTAGLPFALNQAMARGVGAGAPQAAGRALGSTGRATQSAASLLGVTSGALATPLVNRKSEITAQILAEKKKASEKQKLLASAL